MSTYSADLNHQHHQYHSVRGLRVSEDSAEAAAERAFQQAYGYYTRVQQLDASGLLWQARCDAAHSFHSKRGPSHSGDVLIVLTPITKETR